MNTMTKLHMSKKNVPETKIIDVYEDDNIIEFTTRFANSPLFDKRYRLDKKEWEAFFEAQKLLSEID
jgi:hypothetical protein